MDRDTNHTYNFQPSEFIKITVLLMLGYLIVRDPLQKMDMISKYSLNYLWLVPFLLIAKSLIRDGACLFLTGMGIILVEG